MAKTTQVMKLQFYEFGYIVVFHSDDRYNPLWVYRITWKQTEYGWSRPSKKLLRKYADIQSCLWFIADDISHR